MIGNTGRSIREAIRGFTRQKSILAVATLTLALGLGVSTAMLSVVQAVVLRPVAYDMERRLVIAWAGYEGSPTDRGLFTEEAVLEWKQSARAFDGVAGFAYTQFTLLQRGEPTDLQGAVVSPEFFSVLGARPDLGAAFDPEVVRAERGKVIVLS